MFCLIVNADIFGHDGRSNYYRSNDLGDNNHHIYLYRDDGDGFRSVESPIMPPTAAPPSPPIIAPSVPWVRPPITAPPAPPIRAPLPAPLIPR